MSRIDYDLRLIKGIVFDMDGVLSPSTVAVREDGTLQRHSNVKDGFAIQYALRRGLRIAVISGARDESMLPAYNSLGIRDVYFGVSDKEVMLASWMKQCDLHREEVAFVGDDIPDLPAMRMVGLSVTPRDGSDETKAEALYISPCHSGYGVARDLIQQILSAKNLWLTDGDYSW